MSSETVHHLSALNPDLGAPVPKRKRGPRKPTVSGLHKQVRKAGIEEDVRYEVEPNKITVVIGKPDTTVTPLEQWRSKRRGQS